MLQCCRFTTAQTGSSYGTECYNSKLIFTKFLNNEDLITGEKENQKIPISPTDVCDRYGEPNGKHNVRNFNHRATELQLKKQKQKLVKEEFKRQTDFDLSMFWSLKHFAILDDCDAVEPDEPLGSFGENITGQGDGRYCTSIPWKTEKWRLEKIFLMAKGRLESLLTRLKKTQEFLTAYQQKIEQLRLK